MIVDGLDGRVLYSLDDSNPEGIMSMRNKRENPIVSYVHRRVSRQASKHKGKNGPLLGGPPGPSAPIENILGDSPTLITVMDTKYPWIANFSGKEGGGQCPSECSPTTCVVNTTECTATTVECTLSKTACKVIEGIGRCASVCEKCDISNPECYVREPKCVVIKDRRCTVNVT